MDSMTHYLWVFWLETALLSGKYEKARLHSPT